MSIMPSIVFVVVDVVCHSELLKCAKRSGAKLAPEVAAQVQSSYRHVEWMPWCKSNRILGVFCAFTWWCCLVHYVEDVIHQSKE